MAAEQSDMWSNQWILSYDCASPINQRPLRLERHHRGKVVDLLNALTGLIAQIEQHPASLASGGPP